MNNSVKERLLHDYREDVIPDTIYGESTQEKLSILDLILRRGYRILTSGEEISDKDLDLLRKIICTK